MCVPRYVWPSWVVAVSLVLLWFIAIILFLLFLLSISLHQIVSASGIPSNLTQLIGQRLRAVLQNPLCVCQKVFCAVQSNKTVARKFMVKFSGFCNLGGVDLSRCSGGGMFAILKVVFCRCYVCTYIVLPWCIAMWRPDEEFEYGKGYAYQDTGVPVDDEPQEKVQVCGVINLYQARPTLIANVFPRVGGGELASTGFGQLQRRSGLKWGSFSTFPVPRNIPNVSLPTLFTVYSAIVPATRGSGFQLTGSRMCTD